MKNDIDHIIVPQFIKLQYELEDERLNSHGEKVVIITTHEQISNLIAN